MEHVPEWLVILLTVLATHRVTRFVTRDAFPLVAGPRRWIERRWDPFDDEGWKKWRAMSRGDRHELRVKLHREGVGWPNPLGRSVAYLVTCDWCTSIWVGAALVAYLRWYLDRDWPWALLVWLTASTVTGLIAQREPE